ncbi:hypothetical protein HN832_04405 [archaeon]|jgi:vacuolar iron transporter family protein|nr:hypothetical protein [archaeon]MBT4373365.1 hypothetical protein [archaeon]MBT4531813.1 hypothetical protein [archaeon]MBT7001480.1 hypothetical protein [archaeon]MBT7282628.1 hypothetical protein [archaeon]
MKHSIRKGVGFGVTSGIITTLGLLIGLNSSTHSKIVILSGIMVIAFADALSDSMGMHISEEFGLGRKTKEIWQATIYTFFTKFLVTLTFIIPLLILTLRQAIITDLIWGFFLIISFSYFIAKQKHEKKSKVILEHFLITVVVLIISNYIGKLAAYLTQ